MLSNPQYASSITPQLYISNFLTAINDAKLEELGITHVVSLLWTCPPDLPQRIPADQRLYIRIADKVDADILKSLETTTAFITAAISADMKNKVLVHCRSGISRSTTVACAYLVATTDMTASETITHVKSLRKIACPNEGFRRQLESYSIRFIKAKQDRSLRDQMGPQKTPDDYESTS